MMQMDIHDKRLQESAALQALKLGHWLKTWYRDAIIYTSGRKKKRRFVDSYVSECKYCGGAVRIASGLEDQMEGEILMEPCMANGSPETGGMRKHRETGQLMLVKYNY